MKTTNEILTTIWKECNNYAPITTLNGGVYKNVRPVGSTLRDCVISLLSGQSGKFVQSAALYIKIFYADILENSNYYEDDAVGEQLERILYDFSEILLKNNIYSFDNRTRELMVESVPEIHQHFVILKINFQI